MKTVIVYFSKFGHTQKLAETISAVLKSNSDVTLISVDELQDSTLNDADLVVMGTPTHNMNLPKAVRPVFDTLSKRILRGAAVATFDTSYKMSDFLMRFTAAKKLKQKLRKLGGKQIIKPETFFVVEREGPLYGGEIERAHAWAKLLIQQVDLRATRT